MMFCISKIDACESSLLQAKSELGIQALIQAVVSFLFAASQLDAMLVNVQGKLLQASGRDEKMPGHCKPFFLCPPHASLKHMKS